MRLINHLRSQKGDTIVEVLIAMTVASSVLGITYATMNRNLLISQADKERSQASKLAQGQIESIKNMTLTKANLDRLVARGNSPFCLSGSNGTDITPLPNMTIVGTTITFTGCVSSFYQYAIKRDDTDINKYYFYVAWDKVGGGKTEQIIMAYRI